MTAALPELLTEAEAAERIGVAPRTLRDLRGKGKIRYVRPSPRKVYYRADDVAEYIDKQTLQDDPPCPSTNPRKVRVGNTTSSSKGSGILDQLAARPNGMPKGLRLITGGRLR